ncbi:MAG TPA: hypothetical protein VM008_20365, partial [Phycisphaerae bacterium]|nr:hypothetical protein [Phycisphaerae bacterium]
APFIARIDADDLCLPERFERQLAFLQARPEIAVVGSFIQKFSDDAATLPPVTRFPTEPPEIAAALLFRNPLAHPAVMLRKSALDAAALRYDESFRRSQDYALWVQCALRGLPMANLPEVLLKYRVHPGQISSLHLAEQQQTVTRAQAQLIQHGLHIQLNQRTADLHHRLAFSKWEPTTDFIAAAGLWLLTLADANENHKSFPRDPFLRTLTGRYISLHRFAKQNHLPPPPIPETLTPFIHPGALG